MSNHDTTRKITDATIRDIMASLGAIDDEAGKILAAIPENAVVAEAVDRLMKASRAAGAALDDLEVLLP
jgi:hypothetical protein